ncbi:hypothetical protein D3C80_1559810 [compost metagenome]
MRYTGLVNCRLRLTASATALAVSCLWYSSRSNGAPLASLAFISSSPVVTLSLSCTSASWRISMRSPGDINDGTATRIAGAASALTCWAIDSTPALLVNRRTGRRGVT